MITVVLQTEVTGGHGHPAVPRQPPAQLGVGDAREDLHVVVGDGVGHLVTVRHDLAEILSNVTSHKAFSQILREFRQLCELSAIFGITLLSIAGILVRTS